MAHFFRLPWIIGGPSRTARGALTALLSLDASAQNRIRDAIKEVGVPFSKKKMNDKARELHEELKVLDVDTIFNIMDAITDLVPVPQAEVSEVLAEMFKDTGTPFSSLEALIKNIASDRKIIDQRAITEFSQQGLPSLRGIEYVCAIRARFDKDFRYNEDKIESYSPKVVDHHPVVVLRIVLDDPTKNLSFQLDEERLDRLISELIAAQKQLRVTTDESVRARNEKIDAK